MLSSGMDGVSTVLDSITVHFGRGAVEVGLGTRRTRTTRRVNATSCCVDAYTVHGSYAEKSITITY